MSPGRDGPTWVAPKGPWGILCAHSAVRVFNVLAATETWSCPDRRALFKRSRRKPERKSERPAPRLGGGAVGGPRPSVARPPLLRGLEHRVVAAPETLSTAYRAEQCQPQKVSFEKVAGAGAVALKTAAVLTSKLTGSHI
jgi:hypothetical protein